MTGLRLGVSAAEKLCALDAMGRRFCAIHVQPLAAIHRSE